MSTILNCDRIFFIEDGQIIETGDHESLMKQSGRYAKLVKAQGGFNLTNRSNVNMQQGNDDEEVSYD